VVASGEKAAKYRRTNGNLRIPELPEVDNSEPDGSMMDTRHFYNINAVHPSRCEGTLPVESHDDTEDPLCVLCHAAGGSTRLSVQHVSSGSGDEDEASVSDGGHRVTQVTAYFETIPVNGRFSASSAAAADTVLCSALGYKPIASTLPIVSKYRTPPRRPETGAETGTDSDEAEKLDVDSSATETQLEEHW